MEINSEIAFRAVRRNGSKMLVDTSGINTLTLIRELDSHEVISPEVYEDMTDKTKAWSNTDALEHLLKHLRSVIKEDGRKFVLFIEVLKECGYGQFASLLVDTYNALCTEASLQSQITISESGDVLVCNPNAALSRQSTTSSTVSSNSVDTSLPVLTTKEGYEEFFSNEYQEPKLAELLDQVVCKIPSKWYDVGIKLGFAIGVLDGIKADVSLGGDPRRMFQKLLTLWPDSFPSQYKWGVLLQILASPSVGEVRLANSIATHLKGEPYQYEPPREQYTVQQSQFGNGSSTITMVTNQPHSVDMEVVHEVLVKVIESNYHKLNSVIDSSMTSFARLLLEGGIISRDVCQKAEYNTIIQSFTAGLTMKSTIEDTREHCKVFVKALKTIGGPARVAAQRISQQWKDSLQTTAPGILFDVY